MSLCSCWPWKKNKTNNEDHSNEDIESTVFNNPDNNNQRSSESLVGADNQPSQSDDRHSPPITIDHHGPAAPPIDHEPSLPKIDHHEPVKMTQLQITTDDPKLKALAENVKIVQLASYSSSSSGPSRRVPQKAVLISFTPDELASATNNYSDLVGEGGYGPVFKGQLTLNGSLQVIAVKTLNREGTQGNEEFEKEIIVLGNLEHLNLVKLIGFCKQSGHRMLVYEYMPNGSLETHLERRAKRRRLDWKTRMKIAAGAARGLEYLHRQEEYPVILRDVKPANILLDDDLNPKLSDFGLAKIGPTGNQSHVSTRVMGTLGYCAPEYAKTGHLTCMSDVFSFGVVLLELISGRPAVGRSVYDQKTQWLVAWAGSKIMERGAELTNLVDPVLEGQYRSLSANKALSMAVLCVQEFPRDRPPMTDVVPCLDWVVTHSDSTTQAAEPSARGRLGDAIQELDRSWFLGDGGDREKAVAEAKLWGQRFHKKKKKKNVPRINPPAPSAPSPPSTSSDSDA